MYVLYKKDENTRISGIPGFSHPHERASAAQTPCPSLEKPDPKSFGPADEITKVCIPRRKKSPVLYVLFIKDAK